MSFKKWMALLLLSGMLVWPLIGCETAGKAAGETADKIEEGAEDFEKGYEKGRD